MGEKPDPKSVAYQSPTAKFCRGLPGATEDIKWEDHLVFSVGGKMFASMNVDDAHDISFKCDEKDNLRLTQIDGIVPTPYAAKFGWVSVTRKGVLPAKQLQTLIGKSHALVLACLPQRKQLAVLGEAGSGAKPAARSQKKAKGRAGSSSRR